MIHNIVVILTLGSATHCLCALQEPERLSEKNLVAVVEMATRVTDSFDDRLEALHRISILAIDQQAWILGEIVRTTDDDIAFIAARRLAVMGSAQLARSLADKFHTWPNATRSGIVGSIDGSTADIELIEWVRTMLLGSLDEQPGADEDEEWRIAAVSNLAIVLRNAGASLQRDAIDRLLERFPRAMGVWMMRADAGLLAEDELVLAKRLWSDSTEQMQLRLITAAAASRADAEARTMFNDYVSRVLDELSKLPIKQMPKDPTPEQYSSLLPVIRKLRNELLPAVRVLGFIPEEDAMALLDRCLGSSNTAVRNSVGFLAAIEAPVVALRSKPGELSPEQFAQFIAIARLSLQGDEMSTSPFVSPEQMAAAERHLAEIGVDGIRQSWKYVYID